MPFQYVNRRGETYYLLQGKTKTGKPKYYASKKAEGVAVDQVPEGYEIYENPERGLVSIRKVRPSRVLPDERAMLVRWTGELAGIEFFSVDVQEDNLVIYTPETDPAAAVSLLSRIFGSFPDGEGAEKDRIAQGARYAPMLRFTLVDEGKRLYSAERWCFRGSIDGWHFLCGGQPLERLAAKYLPHLNQESFFELM